MITSSFAQLLQYGQEGEHMIAAMLLGLCFFVLPLYQFTSSFAPQIFNPSGSLTSPDLVAFKAGETQFVECKRKNRWVRFNGVETGLNAKHYEHYKALSDLTGIPLYVFFIQETEEPTGIYGCEIHNPNVRHWNGRKPNGDYSGRPEVFFLSESLTRIQ